MKRLARRSILAVFTLSISVAAAQQTPTQEEWIGRPAHNAGEPQKQNDVLFGGYRLWTRVEHALAPGGVSIFAYKGFKFTSKPTEKMEEWLLDNNFEEEAAKNGVQRFTKVLDRTKAKPVFFVVAVFDGAVAAYNVVVDPIAEIPVSRTIPTVTSETEERHLAALRRLIFVRKYGGYMVGALAAVVALVAYRWMRKQQIMRK